MKLIKRPLGLCIHRPGARAVGVWAARGGSLVRFYWKSGEEHGCALAGSQDSDGLGGLIAPRPDGHVCVWDNEREATHPCFCCGVAGESWGCAGELSLHSCVLLYALIHVFSS